MDHTIEHSPNGSSGHEHREANYKLILYSAIGLAVSVVIVMILMWGTFNLLKVRDREAPHIASTLSPPFQVPPEPRLEEHPWESLQRQVAQDEHTLTTYGWQDQKGGVVRIPIQKAMDILARRGFPNQAQGQNTPSARTPGTNTPGAKPAIPVPGARARTGANRAQ